MMLADVHLVEETGKIIRGDQVSAEWALRRALDQIQVVFASIEDPYFRERRSDIDMIGERILRNLLGMTPPGHEGVPKGAVVFAHDLSPADITQLGRAGVSGFFTEGGGKTSHAALVARALGLPLVAGVQDFIKHIRTGMTVIVDGGRGEVILEPDFGVQERFADRAARDLVQAERLAKAREAPAATLDKVRVQLAANVELLEEIPISVELGADAVGLFRTEFLYLERTTLPTEEEQYQHAVAALRAMEGRSVIFRTLDLGGDKLPMSVRIPAGNNPALGLRSIRYSLWRRDLFRSQLRAFYRAAATGPLRIMFPLISGVAEMRIVREVCADVCDELARDGLEHDPKVPLGAMIETPSAAMIADLLVQRVRVPLHRHQRSHPVRPGRRSPGRARRLPLPPAAPGHPAFHPDGGEGRRCSAASPSPCAATWPAIRVSVGCCSGWGCGRCRWRRGRSRWSSRSSAPRGSARPRSWSRRSCPSAPRTRSRKS